MTNEFKIPSLAQVVIYFPEEQRSYISGPLIKPDQDKKEKIVPFMNNSIRIFYSHFYFDSRLIDSSLTKVATAPYVEAWLTRNLTDYSWNINVFNYLAANNSKEIQSIPVVDQANCVNVYYDELNSQYPRYLSFLVFCITFHK